VVGAFLAPLAKIAGRAEEFCRRQLSRLLRTLTTCPPGEKNRQSTENAFIPHRTLAAELNGTFASSRAPGRRGHRRGQPLAMGGSSTPERSSGPRPKGLGMPMSQREEASTPAGRMLPLTLHETLVLP
jgi:hypothetical protein